ncbi:MAG: hypothetical protein FJ138_02765 [Deltaproteobacteria bacterium]|nr:hypothetical protein [Deltaproteobacteria bacterium]
MRPHPLARLLARALLALCATSALCALPPPRSWPLGGGAALAETLVAKSYYIPVYGEPEPEAQVVGNLLKGQAADAVGRRGEWVQVNAFKGLLVGWARAAEFEAGGAPSVTTPQGGVSPTFPGEEGLRRARAGDAPHRGEYRGVQYCVRCHNPGATQIKSGGRPIEVWSQSSHARAYHTLFSPESLKIGQRLGIQNPATSPRCLKCHVTAYGVPAGVQSEVVLTEGVGCEACHGPSGALHGSGGAWDVAPVGQRARFCGRCHNDESPTWRGFNLESFSEYIAHWGHRAEVEQIRAREHAEMSRQSARAGDPPPAPLTPRLTAPPPAPRVSAAAEEGVLMLASGVGAPVRFPHSRHQKDFGLSCSSCHHVPQVFKCRDCHNDTSAVSRQQAFHDGGARSCRSCHREMASKGFAGPRTCDGCHVPR